MEMNPFVNISNLSYKYPNAKNETLRIKNFQMNKGEKVFLFGPSGCGKTTFLEILAGVLNAQEGSVSILGKDISTISSAERDQFRAAHVGYIFQNFNLVPYLSVLENITLPLYLSSTKRKHVPVDKEIFEAELICKHLGIDLKIHAPVTELSVGQQQRVAVARALLGRPELILADEPTSSLDYDHREKFIKLLFEVCNSLGTMLLFVSHDRTLEKLFDRSTSLVEINEARVK